MEARSYSEIRSMTTPAVPDSRFDICFEGWIKECLSSKNNICVYWGPIVCQIPAKVVCVPLWCNSPETLWVKLFSFTVLYLKTLSLLPRVNQLICGGIRTPTQIYLCLTCLTSGQSCLPRNKNIKSKSWSLPLSSMWQSEFSTKWVALVN